MRSHVAEALAHQDDELLTTGEVARLLGVSRQHVVNLVDRGDLPSTLVGKHRRIRKADADLVATSARRTTRDQTRSLLLAHAVAGEIVKDPERALAIARGNLDRMRGAASRGSLSIWQAEWEKLLDGPLVDLLTALTSPAPRSRELRQNHPFAGMLSEADRQRVLAIALPSGRRPQ